MKEKEAATAFQYCKMRTLEKCANSNCAKNSLVTLFHYIRTCRCHFRRLQTNFWNFADAEQCFKKWLTVLSITLWILLLKLEGELTLAPPGFLAPSNLDYADYHKYIDKVLPSESPALYGQHANAEMGYLTATSVNLFKTLLEMQAIHS